MKLATRRFVGLVSALAAASLFACGDSAAPSAPSPGDPSYDHWDGTWSGIHSWVFDRGDSVFVVSTELEVVIWRQPKVNESLERRVGTIMTDGHLRDRLYLVELFEDHPDSMKVAGVSAQKVGPHTMTAWWGGGSTRSAFTMTRQP